MASNDSYSFLLKLMVHVGSLCFYPYNIFSPGFFEVKASVAFFFQAADNKQNRFSFLVFIDQCLYSHRVKRPFFLIPTFIDMSVKVLSKCCLLHLNNWDRGCLPLSMCLIANQSAVTVWTVCLKLAEKTLNFRCRVSKMTHKVWFFFQSFLWCFFFFFFCRYCRVAMIEWKLWGGSQPFGAVTELPGKKKMEKCEG